MLLLLIETLEQLKSDDDPDEEPTQQTEPARIGEDNDFEKAHATIISRDDQSSMP